MHRWHISEIIALQYSKHAPGGLLVETQSQCMLNVVESSVCIVDWLEFL